MDPSTVASQSGRALLLVIFIVLSAASVRADSIRRVPIFRTGILSNSSGPTDVVLANVYGTPVPEIVTCSEGRAFALTRSSDDYVPVWQTRTIDCSAVAAGDLDRDDALEVVIGTRPASGAGSLMVFTPHLFGSPRSSVQIPGTSGVNDLAVGNIDGDEALEIVVVTASDAYVFDAKTLSLEWTVTGKGGTFVGIGDLEGDGTNEIVVSGADGHVLDGVSRSYKWGLAGGFGDSVALGDVDGDGRDEIVGAKNGSTTVTVVDGETMATSSFTTTTYYAVQAIAVGDGDDDGNLEIVVGDSRAVRGFRRDGTESWYVSTAAEVVTGISMGDIDHDGATEAVWVGGSTSRTTAAPYVGDPATHQIEWATWDFDGSFRITAADLDGDGRVELVVASRTDGHGGGSVRVMGLDGRTEFFVEFAWDIVSVVVGQVDSDPALEIVLLTDTTGRIVTVDGATGAVEWTSPTPSPGSPAFSTSGPLLVANMDGDPVDEILVATTDDKIQVLDGATPILQGVTAALDGRINDASFADIDGNGEMDLVVGTSNGYYVLRAADLSERLHRTQPGTRKVAARNGSFAISFDSYPSFTLASFAGDTLVEQWRCPMTPLVRDMQYVTIDSGTWLAVADAMAFQLYPAVGAACPEKVAVEDPLKDAMDIAFADVNADGIQELLVGVRNSAEVDLVTFTSTPRGDANGDGLVTDADLETLAGSFFGTGVGPAAGGDVNGDFALRPDDLLYLINYRRGTGNAPPQ